MPKFEKGSQEAKDYMKSIREKRQTTSNIKYETFKGKKTQKNITMDLDKETEILPSGEKIVKSTTSKKVNGNPVEQNVNQVIVPVPVPKKKGGRPKKYATAEEAKDAKKAQTIASNKKRYGEKKKEKEDNKKVVKDEVKTEPEKRNLKKEIKDKRNERDKIYDEKNTTDEYIGKIKKDIFNLERQQETEETINRIKELTDIMKNSKNKVKKLNDEYNKLDNELRQLENQLKIEGGKINIGKAFKKLGHTIERGFNKTIANPIADVAEQVGNKVADVASDAVDYGKAVVFGRNDFPPKVRNILKKVGNKYVKSITIKRTPVSGLLTGALSIFSLGKFGKRMSRSFDELFHLFIEMTLEDNSRVSLEKNEVINMDMNPKGRPKTESKLVNTAIPHITIDEMLDNTEKYMGKKNFFGYSARDNNCQDFILSFFKSNNIGDESDFSFIKQDTKSLFKDLPYLRKLSNTITDIGAKANVITTGAGVDEIKTYGKMLNHLTHHITDPNEPIDPLDFKQSIELINKIKDQKKNIKGKGLKDKDYIVQSVVFEKDKFNIATAKKWLKTNGFKSPKVDKQENTLRFRQVEPSKIESEGFTEYRTKTLDNSGINLIIAYKKNKISDNNINMSGGKLEVHHYHHMIHHSKDDSDSEMEGGKINIGKAFKKLGSTIEKGFNKEIAKPIEKKVINPAGKYITAKKGGLATDLIDYGIPATTGAILGALGSATGNPALGVLGSAAGSKLGKELVAPAVHKASGAGTRKFTKGSAEAKEHMAKIRAMKGGKVKSSVIEGKVY